MLTPAFNGRVRRTLGTRRTADGDGIVHVANRLMDYHEPIPDAGRTVAGTSQVPTKYAGLLRDCSQLMNTPLGRLQDVHRRFRRTDREMPDLMRYARGAVDADPVLLHMDADDHLINRITKQIRAAAKSQR